MSERVELKIESLSMTEVTPNFKPDAEPCPCGCGTVARPQTRKRKDGLNHARGCPCTRCKHARTRKGGADGQRSTAKRAGVKKVGSFYVGHVEQYDGETRIEVKTWSRPVKTGAQNRPMVTAFDKCKGQSEADRRRPSVRPACPSTAQRQAPAHHVREQLCRGVQAGPLRHVHASRNPGAVRPPRVLDADDHRHGTHNGYVNYKCRCEPCKAANKEYLQWYRSSIAPDLPYRRKLEQELRKSKIVDNFSRDMPLVPSCWRQSTKGLLVMWWP